MKAKLAIFALALVLSNFFPNTELAAHAQQRGLTSSAPCPYSCKTLGIPKRDCRDWREGAVCYVEDLTKHPAAPPSNIQPPAAPRITPFPPSGDRDTEACRQLAYIPPPHVDIGRVRPSGNFFRDQLTITGSVEGICLSEAGYFEYGELEKSIPITTSRSFKRFDFELQVRAGREPQIRVYNINGARDVRNIELNDANEDSEDWWYRNRGGRIGVSPR